MTMKVIVVLMLRVVGRMPVKIMVIKVTVMTVTL